MFVYGGFIYFVLNMFVLWMFGQSFELFFGWVCFFVIYFISGLGGLVMVVCFVLIIVMVGVLGVIFGLMVVLLIIGCYIGVNVFGFLVIFGINFVLGFFIGNIVWQVYFGGVIVGVLVVFIYICMK